MRFIQSRLLIAILIFSSFQPVTFGAADSTCAKRWKKFAKIAAISSASLATVGGVAAYLYTADHRALAESFDLSRVGEFDEGSTIYDRNGQHITSIYDDSSNRISLEYDQISDNFVHALISGEDKNFFSHNGIDYVAIVRAGFLAAKSGEIKSGASTITQQLSRNTFGLDEKSFDRKIVEAALARRLEEEFTKEEILTHYMNHVYFGHSYQGVEAASQGYFGKSAKDLTKIEAAALVGTIRNPSYNNPRSHPTNSKLKRNQVLNRMFQDGFIVDHEGKPDKAQLEELLAQETQVIGRKYQDRGMPYAVKAIKDTVIEKLGEERAQHGDFKVYSTLDSELQKLGQQSLYSMIERVEALPAFSNPTKADIEANDSELKGASYLQGAVLVIDNATGAILAKVGGRDFVDSNFDRTELGKRPAGPAFLPFVYATALENGKLPTDQVEDSALAARMLEVGGVRSGTTGEWGTENFENRYQGPISMEDALTKGAIAAAVRTGMEVGVDEVLSLSRSMGLKFEGKEEELNYNRTLVGFNSNSMSELARAYAAFANKGFQPRDLHIISKIEDSEGNTVFEVPSSEARLTERVIQPETAEAITKSLRTSIITGAAKKAVAEYGVDPKAGNAVQTSTVYSSKGFTDHWTLAYTPEVTVVVWMGYDQDQSIYPQALSSDTTLAVGSEIINKVNERKKAQSGEVIKAKKVTP
ncbi:hypothetical protein GW915_06305 [bacterium]|nr:hypothetical protein [bacterium]